MSCGKRRLVIGLGHPDRGDDAVGLLVAAQLQTLDLHDVHVTVANSPLDLMDAWRGHDNVVVVDAVRAGLPAGSASIVPVGEHPLPTTKSSASTHGVGLAETVELARRLGRLPQHLQIVGVEAADFRVGSGPSEQVSGAVDAAVEMVIDIIRDRREAAVGRNELERE